jgi:hypothetical protein
MIDQKEPQSLLNIKPIIWYENFRVVSFTLGMVSLILIGIHWYLDQHTSTSIGKSLFSYIFKDAGIAGLIALFLNISIEWINRKRHTNNQDYLLAKLEEKHEETSKSLLTSVNKQLFKTVYERNIDPAVFDQVEKHLLRAETMRKDFLASFKVSPFLDPTSGEATNFVKIEFCNTFRLFNLTDKPIEVVVAKAIVDVTPLYRDSCYFKKVTLGAEIIDKDALADTHVKVAPGRNLLKLEIKRIVPPDDSLPVEIEYCKLAPVDYSEIVLTTIPMDGLTLEVSDPQEIYTVDAVSLHPEDEILKTPKDQRHLLRWKIEHAILPGQGIVMFWHPASTISQQNLTAAAYPG